MNQDELFKLAEGTCPHVNKGVVTLTREKENGEEEDVPLPEGVRAYVDEHPEGSDRGGYVPYLESGRAQIFYYEGDGEWQAP